MQLATQHEQAGITINYELQSLQSVGMAHGAMAALIQAKNHFDVESEQFKAFEKEVQANIAKCFVQLVKMGISPEEANKRIMRGH